ncbi:MAG TPA: molybdopterin cofactor-binding domain-containing protein, partial [Burkholderiales bacterium]|nr:molybdopterin cofactor-binding domain-containing protein [Burkholderiales bacterium]
MLAEKPPALSNARRLSQRVHFERDGTVSIASGKVELGQGILTALAQVAAEELGVPLERIRMLPACTAYSPDEGVTSGSLSIQDAGKALRKACAELRALLKRGGASSYWDLQPDADVPGDAPEKPAAEYEVVGTSAPRLDLPGKFAGRPSYAQDMVLPGMLHGRVVRPPFAFKRLLAVEEPKNATLVREGNFLGVLAEREEDAIAAAAKLRSKCTWEPAPSIPDDIHAWLKEHVAERIISKEKADSAAAARGVKRVKAAYTKPYIAHASIGPSCALARWK